ncbi:hypothetical protein MXB_2384 [Myxobolus squamalis]|nr:hypothetical protein MXB_2384 [Myxobolus squamalis]
MSSERYSFSLTTFNPSGKLVQIEYALAAVGIGAATVGIKGSTIIKAHLASNGVVLVSDKKQKSILYDESSIFKLETVNKNIVIGYSGLGPDYRLILKKARKIASSYKLFYGCEISSHQLTQRLSNGAYFAWNATAIGRNQGQARTFLSKRYKNDLELGDAIHLALVTMKECFEGVVTPENVEIAICTPTEGMKLLSKTEVKECVDSAIS